MDIDFAAIIAEQQIREGIEDGKFDDLPGKGKPLDLDADAHLTPEARMANRILKNANVLPEWIQLQQDIDIEKAEVVSFRARILKEHSRRFATVSTLPAEHPGRRYFSEWCVRSRNAYIKRLKSVNTSLLKLTLCAPSTVVVQAGYRLDHEIEAFDREFPMLSEANVKETAEEGLIREVARLKYASGSGGPVKDLLSNPRRLGIDPSRCKDDTSGSSR